MKMRAWGVLLLLLTICLGCSHIQEYIDIAKDEAISKEYLDVLKKWTRDKSVYSQFETRAHIAVTYKSDEFNKAYISEYSRIYELTDVEKREREETVVDLTSDFTEFMFYAYIPEKTSNDFARSDSIWKVFIADGEGGKVYPVEIREIEKITPIIEELFPYVKKYYGKFYTLKFSPLFPPFEQQPAMLVFTSVLGKVELTWGSKN